MFDDVSTVGILLQMVKGLGITLELTFLSFAIALIMGTVLAMMRISPIVPLRACGLVYVEVIRNIPLLAIIVLFVFGLPLVGIKYSFFASVVMCISLYEASYICETLRSGVNTVARGQAEAARSLGLSFSQSMRHVILPQTFRTVVQPLGNVFIGLTLNTSLASVVGVVELTGTANQLNLQLAQPIPLLFGAGAGYLLICVGAGQLIGLIERRVRFAR